ncbi:MAG: type IV secretory system conjugative DNA transfer family protein [Betaproteobacteria bacterium]|nr:type IV secretory system conjugative DNA transfer family protein [Betaproteobacteria bacterium]MDE2423825.1 type IV secretory system conjugative DNA transfer family protein [Betaproteobacteria bacterium]
MSPSTQSIHAPVQSKIILFIVIVFCLWFLLDWVLPNKSSTITLYVFFFTINITLNHLIKTLISLTVLGVLYRHQKQDYLSLYGQTHLGSAHWASKQQVIDTGLLSSSQQGGVYLGSIKHNRSYYYLRHQGDEHIMVFAPTRSGKGVGIVIPTLLEWTNSVLVHDIKGENFHHTSGYRQQVLKQRILKFEPTSRESHRFNPLKEIRLGSEFETRDVQNIATMIVDPDGRGLNDHWTKTGFDLLVGVILHVLYAETDKSLSRVQSLLSTPGKSLEQIMKEIQNTLHLGHSPHPIIVQSAQSFLNKAPNEASGVLSTALSFLSLYKDEVIAENTRTSDFSIESLMQEASTLYLIVPPSDKDRLKPLTRLIINQVVRRLTEKMDFDRQGQGRTQYQYRLLLLLDEFPSLGKLDIFEESLAFIAGYGLKAVLIIQDISQLYAAYGKNESIMSNCHIRVAYAPNKIDTAELLSRTLGNQTLGQSQHQFSGSRFSLMLNHTSKSIHYTARALLTADEVMRLPSDHALIMVTGHSPIYAKKIRYFEEELFHRKLLPPVNIFSQPKETPS